MRGVPAAIVFVLLSAASARADNADTCPVPAYLLNTESPLPMVAEAIKAKGPLNILVIGSRSSSLNGPDGPSSSYPARLEAALREKLPGMEVDVILDLRSKQTAAEVAEAIGKMSLDRKPALVIWQTGTVDAMHATDPDEFRGSLNDGLAAIKKLGSDAILMNLQYSPRVETMLAVASYNDTIRVVSQEQNIPMFDRFSIMRQWSEAGDFDLFNTTHGFAMARRVHDCIGRALSRLVVDAAHIHSAEPQLQR